MGNLELMLTHAAARPGPSRAERLEGRLQQCSAAFHSLAWIPNGERPDAPYPLVLRPRRYRQRRRSAAQERDERAPSVILGVKFTDGIEFVRSQAQAAAA